MMSALPANVSGSNPLASTNNRLCTACAAAAAPANPITMPATASTAPWRTTMPTTLPGDAPIAMRTPISAARCDTV